MSVIRFENTSYFAGLSYSKIMDLMNVLLGNIQLVEDNSTNGRNVIDKDNVSEGYEKILLVDREPQSLYGFSSEDHQQICYTYLSFKGKTCPSPVLFQTSDEEVNKTIIVWETSITGLAIFKSLAEILGGSVYLNEKLIHSVSNEQSSPQNEFLYLVSKELDVDYYPDIKFSELYQNAVEVLEDDLSSYFFKKIANQCMTIAAASTLSLTKEDLKWSLEELKNCRVKNWELPLVSPDTLTVSIKNNFKIS